jgi:aspartate aminotransferase
MKNLNTQFDSIRQSATVAMADRILALKASGQEIVGLQVGDPDFATPPAVVDVAINAMSHGLTHYASSRGNADLLVAIAKKLQRDEGVSYDPASEILVTHGGIHAYYTAIQSILNPGDDVLVPDPSWATHSNMATMLRGNVIRVPAPAENGFIPYFDSWEKAITPMKRVIVLNYP